MSIRAETRWRAKLHAKEARDAELAQRREAEGKSYPLSKPPSFGTKTASRAVRRHA